MTPHSASQAAAEAASLQSLQQENETLKAALARLTQQLSNANAQIAHCCAILDHLPVLVGYWDTQLVNRYANGAYLDWFGVDPSRVLGYHLRDLLGDTLYRMNLPYVEGALAGKLQQFEREIPNPKDKRSRHAMAQYIPDVSNGVVKGFVALVMDVSALKESEERYRTVVMDQTELISRLHADGRYLFANEAYCRFFGKTLQELMDTNWHPVVHPDDLVRVGEELSQLAPDHPVVMIENRVLSASGTVHWMQFSNRGIFDAQGKLLQIQSVGRDISERKQAETALHQLNQDLTASRRLLREMAAQNESRIERERKYFAQEVHEELGQLLTAIRMEILLLDLQFGPTVPALSAKVEEMKDLVDRTIGAVRHVAANLRPVVLDLGLVDAIQWLSREFTQKTNVPCMVVVVDPLIALDERRSVVLFRIVQESLTNITRYAQAKNVKITIRLSQGFLIAQVHDDGVGFNPHASTTGKTYGLLGMKERALALGGDVQITSAQGSGTLVAVTIPIEEQECP